MRQRSAETLVTEEPYALIAHVRVCGGAGWVTTGSTRKPTPNSLRSCVAAAIGRGSPRAFGLSLGILRMLLDSIPGGDTLRVQYVNLLENAFMQKKLTITLDETVYDGLHRVIGRRRISRFIEELVRPHILAHELEAAYQQMAQDETREAEALAWAEATVGDVSDEPR